MRNALQMSDSATMDLFVIGIFILFSLSIGFQFLAIAVRRVAVSLFFSFLNSVVISLIIFGLGYHWLSLTNLFMFAGITYFSLITTSLLIHENKDHRPKRRMTFAVLVTVTLVLVFIFVAGLLLPEMDDLPLKNNFSLDGSAVSLIASEHGVIFFLIAMLALQSFIGVLLLVRHDSASRT